MDIDSASYVAPPALVRPSYIERNRVSHFDFGASSQFEMHNLIFQFRHLCDEAVAGPAPRCLNNDWHWVSED